MKATPWSNIEGGLCLEVRLTPRSGRDAIDGARTLGDGQPVLGCRVRCAPVEGEANAALITLLAKALAVPRSAIALTEGASSRCKTLLVSGDAASLGARLLKLTG